MTPASKLAQLSPDGRIARIRAEEARAERAEIRLACWAWSHVLGEIGRWSLDQPCGRCGGTGWEHLHDYGDCGAFTAATDTSATTTEEA